MCAIAIVREVVLHIRAIERSARAGRSRSRPITTPILSRRAGAPSIVVIGGWSRHGIALGVRVGQLIVDALVAGAPLPSWGAVPDASAD